MYGFKDVQTVATMVVDMKWIVVGSSDIQGRYEMGGEKFDIFVTINFESQMMSWVVDGYFGEVARGRCPVADEIKFSIYTVKIPGFDTEAEMWSLRSKRKAA